MSSEKEAGNMNQDETPALLPNLRFPDFRGAEGWAQVTLKSIADPVRERAVQSEGNEVLSLSAEYGLVLQGDFFGKKVAGDNIERYLQIVRNDFVYNDRTTKASDYGTIKRLSRYASGIVSPIYKCFRFGNQEDSAFWEYYFESGVHDIALRGLVNEGARAGRFNISISQFLSTIASRPEISEQQKIADCLSSLDELIAAQAQNVEALKTHKKGLMQQLFPREGELQPRLRFLEFQNAGEWEETELGQCLGKVIDYRGKPPPKAESGVPLITAKNVRFGWLDMTNDEYIEADAYDSWMTKGIPTVGDILFTTEAPLGNVGMFPAEGTYALGQRIITLRCKTKKCIPEFLFQSLLGPELQERIDFHSTGSTAKGIKSSVFVTLAFRHPKVPEQQRIADFLSSLDFLISAENHKLEALMSHKKGLMQQLFPSTGGDEI
jgi:type I restriction enzyme S subunit